MVEKFEKKFLGTWWVKEIKAQNLGKAPDFRITSKYEYVVLRDYW
jgi:hypothetical protein